VTNLQEAVAKHGQTNVVGRTHHHMCPNSQRRRPRRHDVQEIRGKKLSSPHPGRIHPNAESARPKIAKPRIALPVNTQKMVVGRVQGRDGDVGGTEGRSRPRVRGFFDVKSLAIQWFVDDSELVCAAAMSKNSPHEVSVGVGVVNSQMAARCRCARPRSRG
jgi:hypothetical protein